MQAFASFGGTSRFKSDWHGSVARDPAGLQQPFGDYLGPRYREKKATSIYIYIHIYIYTGQDLHIHLYINIYVYML